jgi:ATP:dephospho-CoA triphosphoribosyl transferase
MDIRREVLRNIVLCQLLEPLGKKPGCTSRYEDSSPGTKLEYFLVSAPNSAWAFYDLADRVLDAGRQPESIYDLAYEAQAASTRNRLGGKVNFGLISLLVPVVTAQMLQYLETGANDSVEDLLGRTAGVFKNAGTRDLACLEDFIHLGYQLSARHHERLGRIKPVPGQVLTGSYATVWDVLQDRQHIHSVREMVHGYPYCQRIYRFLLHNLETGLLSASELIYRFLLPEVGRPDALADMIVVGFYLMLVKHPNAVLIP